jgi:hypothetical protein
MGFRRPYIAGPSDAEDTYGLGDGGLSASALGILGLVGCGPFTLPGCLYAVMLFMGSHGDRSPRAPCTIDAAGAGLAITLREFDLDDGIVTLIKDRSPTATQLPHRARGLLLLPVNRKVAGIAASSRPRLPSVIRPGGAQPFHAVLALTGSPAVPHPGSLYRPYGGLVTAVSLPMPHG